MGYTLRLPYLLLWSRFSHSPPLLSDRPRFSHLNIWDHGGHLQVSGDGWTLGVWCENGKQAWEMVTQYLSSPHQHTPHGHSDFLPTLPIHHYSSRRARGGQRLSPNLETREEKPRATGQQGVGGQPAGQKRRASPVWQKGKQIDGGWQGSCEEFG